MLVSMNMFAYFTGVCDLSSMSALNFAYTVARVKTVLPKRDNYSFKNKTFKLFICNVFSKSQVNTRVS